MGTGVSPPLSPPETSRQLPVGSSQLAVEEPTGPQLRTANCQLPTPHRAERRQRQGRDFQGYELPPTLDATLAGVIQEVEWSSPRLISTGGLHPLPDFHRQPIDVVLFHEPYPVFLVGGLILRRASHLDAFSAYPFPT